MNPAISAIYTSGTLSITLVNPGSVAPTSVTVQVAGGSISVPLTNNAGSVTISVHPSVGSWSIPASVAAAGGPYSPPIPNAYPNLGVPTGQIGSLQLVPPAASGAPYMVAPTQYATLTAWSMGLTSANAIAVLATAVQDLMTVVGMAVDATVKQAKGVAFTTADQTALGDLETNILPSLPITLSAGPATAQYTQLLARLAAYQQSVAAYQQACSQIPSLV